MRVLRRVTLLALMTFLLSYQSIAGTWSKPAHTWGGLSPDSASSVAVDASGNLYIAGYTESFGAGGLDVLITKFGPAGNFIWAKTWGGGSDEFAYSIKLGPDGYVYVAGYTSSFGAGWYDLFLLKLDPGGSLIWATTWGGSSFDGGHDIAFDAAGNIYVVGESYSVSPCCAVILLKFSTSGNLLQATSYKGPATYDTGYSLAVDSNYNVIIAGISWDYSYSPLHNSLLLLKYDPNGNLMWQQNWATPFPGQDEAVAFHALATDAAGNIYVGGRHSAQCEDSDFTLCDFDALVLKLDTNGNFQWAKTWGAAGTYDGAWSVALDPKGHLLASGVEDSFGTPLLFMLSFDASGNLLSQTGWASQNTASPGMAVGMALDTAGDAYLVSSASNNTGVWAATSATAASLPNSLVTNTYSVGVPSFSTSVLTNPTASQTGTKDTGGGGPDLFVAQYQSYISGGSPFLTVFPLKNWNPYSPQRINSVFDHTMTYQYCPSLDSEGNQTVMAYDGEEGTSQFEKSQVGAKPFGCNPTNTYHDLYGYGQSGGTPFSLYGEYFGGGTRDFLFYEGHPGYDYRAACHTKVYAATSGYVHYPTSIPGAGGATFHILEIDPDASSIYRIYYLHLANWLSNNCIYSGEKQNCTCQYVPNVVREGEHVDAGDVIGYSGDTGVPLSPHLHFEVQLQPVGIPVDPYGWIPIPGAIATDPYSRAVNLTLWDVP